MSVLLLPVRHKSILYIYYYFLMIKRCICLVLRMVVWDIFINAVVWKHWYVFLFSMSVIDNERFFICFFFIRRHTRNYKHLNWKGKQEADDHSMETHFLHLTKLNSAFVDSGSIILIINSFLIVHTISYL